jgi:hypothetical protein
MTRFRSSLAPLLLTLALCGCVERLGAPLGEPLGGDLAYAYIPLKRPVLFVSESDAGGVALGGGVAVTVAHADEMLDPKSVIGTSADYDLMFFRTDRGKAVLTSETPKLGQRVVSYAHYEDALYRAEGVITQLDAPVKARCNTCAVQYAFAFDGNAGPGYSGGPVLDAGSGKLIGILFGYVDKPGGGRTLYAYPMSRVWDELKKIQSAPGGRGAEQAPAH